MFRIGDKFTIRKYDVDTNICEPYVTIGKAYKILKMSNRGKEDLWFLNNEKGMFVISSKNCKKIKDPISELDYLDAIQFNFREGV